MQLHRRVLIAVGMEISPAVVCIREAAPRHGHGLAKERIRGRSAWVRSQRTLVTRPCDLRKLRHSGSFRIQAVEARRCNNLLQPEVAGRSGSGGNAPSMSPSRRRGDRPSWHSALRHGPRPRVRGRLGPTWTSKLPCRSPLTMPPAALVGRMRLRVLGCPAVPLMAASEHRARQCRRLGCKCDLLPLPDAANNSPATMQKDPTSPSRSTYSR